MTTQLSPNGAPPTMRCPKCAAEMVTYERSGIHVDQCRECRGIFLDRGELERLVDAESNGTGWAGPQAPSSYPAVGGGYPGAYPAGDPRPGFDPRMRPDDRAGFRYRDDDDDRRFRRNDWDDRGRWDGRGKPPKRRSLLGELLEGLGD